MPSDRMVTVSKHEVVVDRDWLDGIAFKFEQRGLMDEAKEIRDVAYPQDEEEEHE